MLATHVYDASTMFALDTTCPCFQLDLNDLERIAKMKKLTSLMVLIGGACVMSSALAANPAKVMVMLRQVLRKAKRSKFSTYCAAAASK